MNITGLLYDFKTRKSKYDYLKVGDFFEGLLVLKLYHIIRTGHRSALFRCHCGENFYRTFSNIQKGKKCCSKCSRWESSKSKYIIKDRRLYGIWKSMNRRCSNSEDDNYHHYGGRGIEVCEEWRDNCVEGFNNFYKDMGIYPSTLHTVERKDVNGNYNKDNCCWATQKEQGNNKRDNHTLMWKGQKYTISEISDILGIKANTLCYRLRRGWSVEEAIRGYRETAWKRPLRKLTDEQFDNLLHRYFNKNEKCYRLSKEYGVDSGNLNRVLKDKKVLEYFEELTYET